MEFKCPYCRSTNIAADGEYVCRDCGTVIGPVLLPPIVELTQTSHKVSPTHIPAPLRRAFEWYREYVKGGKYKKSVKRRYLDMVKEHLDEIAEALGAEVAAVALELFRGLDKRVYQGRSPRVVAATLAYIAAERLRLYTHKRVIAEILGVSKQTIGNAASRLRKHLV